MAESKLSGLDYQKIVEEARHRWLLPVEICEILENHERLTISQKPAEMPKSGSLFFYDRKRVRFRNDGYRWKKTKAGKTVKEGHEKLRCNGVVALNCYYAHAEENENFHRRSYWMLKEDLSRIVLVHYREVKAMAHVGHVRDHKKRKHQRPTVCFLGRQEGSVLLKDELTEEMLQNALARVKSPVQYPQQKEQYRNLLNVITEILVACDNALNGPEGTTNYSGDLQACLDFDADTFLPTETSKVVSDNVLNGPEGTTNIYDDLQACLDFDADTFLPTETSKQGHPVPPIVPNLINYHSPLAQGWDTWYNDDDLMSNHHIDQAPHQFRLGNETTLY